MDSEQLIWDTATQDFEVKVEGWTANVAEEFAGKLTIPNWSWFRTRECRNYVIQSPPGSISGLDVVFLVNFGYDLKGRTTRSDMNITVVHLDGIQRGTGNVDLTVLIQPEAIGLGWREQKVRAVQENSKIVFIGCDSDGKRQPLDACNAGALSFRMRFKIGLEKGPTSHKNHCSDLIANKLHNESLINVLKDDEHADVAFSCSDEQLVTAHKCILSARSEVFKAQFRNPHNKYASGRLMISCDFSSQATKILLQYIYTGKMTDEATQTSKVMTELLNAAEMYHLPHYTEMLASIIASERGKDVNYHDVKLLRLVQLLSFADAETTVLSKIREKMMHFKNSNEIYSLFGYDNADIRKLAKEFESSKGAVLELFEYIVAGKYKEKGNLIGNFVKGLAFIDVGGAFATLNDMLEKMKNDTRQMKSAQEFFNLFGYGNEKID